MLLRAVASRWAGRIAKRSWPRAPVDSDILMRSDSRSLWPLLLLAAALSATDAFLGLTYPGRRLAADGWLAWFRGAAEGTVPTLFTVAVTMGAGLGCWRQPGPARGSWRLLGSLLCYLAIDDLLMLHERIGAYVHPWFADTGVYGWVLVLGPLFGLVAGFAAWRLWGVLAAEPARRRRLLVGFAVLGLALVCEGLENQAVGSSWRLRGIELLAYSLWIEESFELLGAVLLFSATWPRLAPAASAPPAVVTAG
jgi:hypothetical protein